MAVSYLLVHFKIAPPIWFITNSLLERNGRHLERVWQQILSDNIIRIKSRNWKQETDFPINFVHNGVQCVANFIFLR